MTVREHFHPNHRKFMPKQSQRIYGPIPHTIGPILRYRYHTKSTSMIVR